MHRAFTIIEILVVLVLLAVLSGIIVARITSAGARAQLVEAERLGALFDAAARRATTRAQPMLVRYNPPNANRRAAAPASDDSGGSFSVMSRPVRVGRFALLQGDWEPDPLIAPVTLNALRITNILRNDAPQRFEDGFGIILNDPAVIAQRTTIILAPPGDARSTRQFFEIRLSSDARRVRTITDPAALDPQQLTPDGLIRVQTLDLDAQGLGEVAW